MTTTPQSMIDLPELPDAIACVAKSEFHPLADFDDTRIWDAKLADDNDTLIYTADQLREYGRLCRATAEQAGKVEGFDAWFANPYTEVLMKSIKTDYVPRTDAKPTQPAATQQPVATVHSSDTPGHFAIITPALPRGTKLYAAPVSPSREVEALEREVRIGRESARRAQAMYARVNSLATEWAKSTGVEMFCENAAEELRAALAPVQEKAP